MDLLYKYYQHLSTFGQVAIVLNIMFFILSGVIFKHFAPTDDEAENKRRVRWLRLLNLFYY